MTFLKKFFNLISSSNSSEAPSRNPLPTTVAACILLLETAFADDVFDDEEKHRIRYILKTKFDVPDADIESILSRSRNARNNAIDLWHFTNRINETCDVITRKKIMEYIWEVVYADGKLSQHEDYLAHKLAHLLRLNHRDFIEAKLAAKQSLQIREKSSEP